MSDGPQHDPGETQPVQPPEGTRPLPSWQVPPYPQRETNGEYSVQQPDPPQQPPAPPHYPPGQYPTTPYQGYPGGQYPPQYPTQYPGQYPGAYGYPGYGPVADSPRGQAIGALVVNIVLVMATCFAGLPSIAGLIVAAVAIGTSESDPQQARTLLKWSWGLAITTVALGALFLIGAIALGTISEGS
jgi:hypothetical protein